MWPQLAMLLPSLLASLRSSGPQSDPTALFQQLFQGQLGMNLRALEPARAAGERAAIGTGNALAQDVSGALGRVGGAATGAGRVARALGTGTAGNLVAESESRIRQQAVEMSRMNALQLLAPQLGFAEGQRGPTENLLDWFSRAGSSGVLMQLFQNAFQGSGQGAAGGQPGGRGIGTDTSRFGFNQQGRPPGFGMARGQAR